MKLINILLIVLLFSSCTMYEDVQVNRIEDIAITAIKKDHIDMEVTIQVDNPNWYKVKLVNSDIEVNVNDESIGNVEFLETIVLDKKSSGKQTLKMRGYNDNLSAIILKNLFTVMFTKEIKVNANGYIKGRALGVSKKVPVEATENVSIEGLDL